MPDDLHDALERAAARVGVAFALRFYEQARSTMDLVEEAAGAGVAEGLVVVAGEQTHGRGRRGHSWSSPPGSGLYLSLLLRPSADPGRAPALALLTLAAGVAVREAIARATGLHAELKWPNDVMVGRRKLAGILAEGIGVGSSAATVILGIGINILSSAYPADVAAIATSLESELGRPVDRGPLFEEVLVSMWQRYDQLARGNASDILREWRAGAPSAHGTRIEWEAADGVRRGVARGIDETGALLADTDRGRERIVGGRVTWERGH